ncbi:rRNA maturation RNase YbeY [Facklamia languida]
MNLEIIDDHHYLTSDQLLLIEEVLQLAGQKLKRSDQDELDVTLVDNPTIQTLNRDYRGKDQVTDVLSFALLEGEEPVDWSNLSDTVDYPTHLGDIIIAYQRAVDQAEEYGHSIDRELAFLAVHGFLHLNGYDHQTQEEELEMFRLQEEVLEDYGLTR